MKLIHCSAENRSFDSTIDLTLHFYDFFVHYQLKTSTNLTPFILTNNLRRQYLKLAIRFSIRPLPFRKFMCKKFKIQIMNFFLEFLTNDQVPIPEPPNPLENS